MFGSIFAKSIAVLKTIADWLRENIKFIFAVFPVYVIFALGALYIYGISKFASLIPWPEALRNLEYVVYNAILYLLLMIFEFIFSNLKFILVMTGLVIFFVTSIFFQERKNKKRLPIVGIPNKDKVTVLLALFELRCLEIGRLYSIVREYQKKAGKSNWVELFLMEYLNDYNMNDNWYRDGNEKKIQVQKQKNKKIVSRLVSDKFDFYKWWSDDAGNSLNDLVVAFKLENHIFDIIRLQALSTHGELQNTLSALMDLYCKFYSRPTILFIYDKPCFGILKPKIFSADEAINDLWDKIIDALKSSLIFLKMQKDTFFDIEQILKEIDALKSLQSKMAIKAIMKQKNSSEQARYSLSAPSKECENLILNKIKNNPLLNL